MLRGEQRRKEQQRRLLEEASKDPVYVAEVEELEREFEYADAEAWRMIEDMEEGMAEGERL